MKKLLLSFLAFALCISVNAQSDLVITEIMYNPPEAGTDSLEFIEIYNKGAVAVNLNNYTCTGGNYTFPNVSLNSGTFYLIAVDMVAFNNVYGLPADGQFSNGLSNAGEDIVLKDDLGNIMDSVDYDDGGVWPSGSSAGNPGGGGSSIVLCDENLDNNIGSNWSPSTNTVGVTINGFPVLASPGITNNCCVATFGIDPLTACDSLIWTNGVTYYANNFTAKDTLVNAAGCDSIVTLDLAVNYSKSGTDTRVECDSLVWIDNNTYFTNNNTATHILSNLGCDSLVTLNLTILGNSSTSTDILVACDSLIWLDGNTYFTSNSTATHIIPNAIGCDSIIALNLTVNNSTSVIDNLAACDSLTWIDGNTYFTSNNTATHIIPNTIGCDSITALNLTINQTPIVTIGSFDPDTICENDNPIILPTGNPIGGSYTGNGVSGNMFDPSIAGIGIHTIYYNFSDSLGCSANDSAQIIINSCVSINENITLSNISIFPNPANEVININLGNVTTKVNITIIAIDGKVVYHVTNVTDKTIAIDISNNSKGIYFLHIDNINDYVVYKMIKL